MSQDNGQEAFDAALSGADAPTITAEPSAPVDPGPAASPDAGGPPDTTPQATPSPAASEGMVPSWRLKELADERRTLAREAAELRQWRQEREETDRKRQEEEAAKSADFTWDDPQGFVDTRLQSGVKQALDPVQTQMREMAVNYSRRFAEQAHGAEAVRRAYAAAMEAAQRGDPGALMLNQRVATSQDPYGEIIDWHKRQDVFTKTGGDLQSYEKKLLDEKLKDPAFLARAIEAARQSAVPVTTGMPNGTGRTATAMPSLNRTVSAADDASEEEDSQAVFKASLAAGRSRR